MSDAIRVTRHTYGGVRTRALSVGPRRRGLRVVLLHGFGDTADTWRGVLEEFAARGLSAVAVDQPGFGEADDLADGPILPQLDAFLAALVASEARSGQVVLVGNSMGGTAAVRAAQNQALPLAGVISIAAPGFSDSWLLRALSDNALPVRLYSWLPVPVPGLAVRAIASTVIPRILFARPGSACPDAVARFASLVRDHRSTKALLGRGQALLAELADAYRPENIRCQLLVVAGRRDRLVDVEAGMRLHADVEHSTLRILDDCGHFPQLDDPGLTADLIANFTANTGRRTLVAT